MVARSGGGVSPRRQRAFLPLISKEFVRENLGESVEAEELPVLFLSRRGRRSNSIHRRSRRDYSEGCSRG